MDPMHIPGALAARLHRGVWLAGRQRRLRSPADPEALGQVLLEPAPGPPGCTTKLLRLGRYPLLVVDEVGYVPFES